MKRYLLAILFGLALSTAAWPQDAGQDQQGTADTAAPAADEPADQGDDQTGQVDAEDDSDLDQQGYENQDDDFKPSEEIPADQSIAFPTDI